jgi:DNA repair protein RadC
MPITDWPAHERPREKLRLRGPQALSDAELLAIFLRTGIRGKTAVDLARELLSEYGSLRDLLQADYRRFCRSPGLGMAKYRRCSRWVNAICARRCTVVMHSVIPMIPADF